MYAPLPIVKPSASPPVSVVPPPKTFVPVFTRPPPPRPAVGIPVSAAAKAPTPAKKDVPVAPGITVNRRQQGNPVLRQVKNVPWSWAADAGADAIPVDFRINATTGVLFLSLRFHMLHGDYIRGRISEVGGLYAVRVLLVVADVEDCADPLREVNVIAASSGWTLLVAWSNEEAARYIETFKIFEKKSADAIKEQPAADEDMPARIAECLTTVRSINRTDAATLLSHFGTLHAIANATIEELALCPGLGPSKVKRLYDAFHVPLPKSRRTNVAAAATSRP